MCGICGFIQSIPIGDEKILKQMNDKIVHRGPDDEGFYFNKRVGLAAKRLSIIDLNTGHQPLPSSSKNSWITFNGEIYNFKELKNDLLSKGYKFRTSTDTEVIVNLYEEYGIEFIDMLRGMFAFGIYDIKKDSLLIARDHVGIKPLYYCLQPDNNLVFGSELKTILQYPGIDRELDKEAADHFFTLEYIPAPFSIFKSIKKLPAGHYLLFKNDKIEIKKYWNLTDNLTRDKKTKSFMELKEEFLFLLRESVEMRMISDVPLGSFLSGGLDSSAIVAMMSQASKEKIKTFSVGFEEKSYSELQYSDIISKKFGTDHYVKNLSPDINDLVSFLTDFLDEPLGDFSNFPTYLVSKTAREKVTVALSGDGGDEIFGGYEHYIAQKMAKTIDLPLIRSIHPAFSKITNLFPPSKLKKGFVNRIKRFSEGLANPYDERHFRWMKFLSNVQKKELYTPEFFESSFLNKLNEREPFKEYFDDTKNFEGINKDLYLDFKTYMVDNILVKVDRMSMATSLEARVPLLDKKMVEFAFSLPPEYKLKGNTTKWFFKKAMENILPKEIIYRRKEGFSIPIKNWLKTDLKDLMMEYLSPERIKNAGVLNPEYVNRLITEHLNNKQNHAHRLWSFILFNIWTEKFSK